MSVARLRNDTSEHIDTKSITDKIRTSLIKSGKVRFSALDMQSDLMGQYKLQGTMADTATAKTAGKQTGAKYILGGNISSIVKQNGRVKDVYYKITLQATDIESAVIVWADDVEIRKDRCAGCSVPEEATMRAPILLVPVLLAPARAAEVKPIWMSVLPAQPGRVYGLGVAGLAGNDAQALRQASDNARADVISRLRANVKADTRITTTYQESRATGTAATGTRTQNAQVGTQVQAQAADLPGLVVEETFLDRPAASSLRPRLPGPGHRPAGAAGPPGRGAGRPGRGARGPGRAGQAGGGPGPEEGLPGAAQAGRPVRPAQRRRRRPEPARRTCSRPGPDTETAHGGGPRPPSPSAWRPRRESNRIRT